MDVALFLNNNFIFTCSWFQYDILLFYFTLQEINTSTIVKILYQFVVLIFYYFVKHCKLNKQKIMQQNYSNFTQLKEKKKWLVKQCKLNKPKLPLLQGIRSFYIQIIYYKSKQKQIDVLEKRRNSSHQIGQMP